MSLRPALALAVAVLALLAAPASRAADDVPRTMTFQGRLVRADGTPESTPQELTFTLYNTLTGGTPLWQERHPSVPVTNGYYAVVLGSAQPLRYELTERNELYLGVAIAGQSELTPRLPLVSVPFALRAQDSQRLDGRAATTFASVDHGHPTATTTAAGFMSAADKTKLDAPGPTYGDGLTASGTPLNVRVAFPTSGGTNGTSRNAARADHAHAAATTTTAGFMSAADKTKLDAPRPALSCSYRSATGNVTGDDQASVAWCATNELLTGGGCGGMETSPGLAFNPTGVTVVDGSATTGGPGYRCRSSSAVTTTPTAYAICCRVP